MKAVDAYSVSGTLFPQVLYMYAAVQKAWTAELPVSGVTSFFLKTGEVFVSLFRLILQ